MWVTKGNIERPLDKAGVGIHAEPVRASGEKRTDGENVCLLAE